MGDDQQTVPHAVPLPQVHGEHTAGESPMTWARLSVGFTEETILVWCVRHDKRVTEIEIKRVLQ